MTRRTRIDLLLLAPLPIALMLPAVAALLTDPSGCSANTPGACFALAILTGGVFAPLALVCTVVLAVRLATRAFRSKEQQQ